MSALKWFGLAIAAFLALEIVIIQPAAPASHPGLHKATSGNWALNPGCHWVYPDNESDLQAYCGDRVTETAPTAPKSTIDSYFDRLDTWCYYHPHSWRC